MNVHACLFGSWEYIGASYMRRTSKNPKPILKVSDMSLFSVYSSSTHTFGQSLFMSEGKSHVCNLPSVLFWKQKKEMRLNSCDTCESYGPACLLWTFSPQLLLWKSDGQKRKGTSLIILLQLLKKKSKVIIFLHDVEKCEIHLLFSPRIV